VHRVSTLADQKVVSLDINFAIDHAKISAMSYPLPHHDHSWEEYLALEAQSEERYEYHDGEIVAMSGATNRHNNLVTNLTVALKPKVVTLGCDYYAETAKLFRHRSDRYLYPDAMVTCAPLDLQSKNGVRSPLLVVEVISKGSGHRDHGFKLREYVKLPSLQHYLIVSQEMCLVQHFRRRAEEGWDFLFYDELDQQIELPELALRLPVAEIYQGIEFGPELSEAEAAAARYEAAREE